MSTIEIIVENFFECISCRQHFLKAYRDCLYDRCDDKLTKQTNNYEALQLWLWRFHNAVNIRVRQENYEKGIPKKAENIEDALWPQHYQCMNCWLDLSKQPSTIFSFQSQHLRRSHVINREAAYYNASEVANFLRTSYWT